MKRTIEYVKNLPEGQMVTLKGCNHTFLKRSTAKWFAGDELHCPLCTLEEREKGGLELQPDGSIHFDEPCEVPGKKITYYRIRATEILHIHQVGKREPLVRYFLEGTIKGGMKFADKRDAQDIVDALDHEQLTAVTFLIKFRHEVVEVDDEQT